MDEEQAPTLLARFFSPDDEPVGPQLSIPTNITVEQLQTLLNEQILQNVMKYTRLI